MRAAPRGVIGDGDGDGDAIPLLIQGRAGHLRPFNSRKVTRIRRRPASICSRISRDRQVNRSLLFPDRWMDEGWPGSLHRLLASWWALKETTCSDADGPVMWIGDGRTCGAGPTNTSIQVREAHCERWPSVTATGID